MDSQIESPEQENKTSQESTAVHEERKASDSDSITSEPDTKLWNEE